MKKILPLIFAVTFLFFGCSPDGEQADVRFDGTSAKAAQKSIQEFKRALSPGEFKEVKVAYIEVIKNGQVAEMFMPGTLSMLLLEMDGMTPKELVAYAANAKREHESKEIKNQLMATMSSGQQYILETGAVSVSAETLIESGYLSKREVDKIGPDYEGYVVSEDGGTLTFGEVTYEY